MFEVEILRNIRESFGGDEALVFWQTVTHLGDAGLMRRIAVAEQYGVTAIRLLCL